MDPTAEACAVHRAALKSRQDRDTVPVLSKIGPWSVTEECSSCPLCQMALKIRAEHTRPGGTAAALWERLWTETFPGIEK